MKWIVWAALPCLFAIGAPAREPSDTAPDEVKKLLVNQWNTPNGGCLGALKWLVTGTGPANNVSPEGQTPFTMAMALLKKGLSGDDKERDAELLEVAVQDKDLKKFKKLLLGSVDLPTDDAARNTIKKQEANVIDNLYLFSKPPQLKLLTKVQGLVAEGKSEDAMYYLLEACNKIGCATTADSAWPETRGGMILLEAYNLPQTDFNPFAEIDKNLPKK